MKPTGPKTQGERMLSRRDFMQLLEAAFQTESFRFARQAALSWLASFPGDLWVKYCLGKAQLGEGRIAQAAAIFEKMCMLDPEFVEGREALVTCYRQMHDVRQEQAQACAFALGSSMVAESQVPEWGKQLRAARMALAQGNLEAADLAIQQVVATTPDLALVAVTHIRLAALSHQQEVVFQLASAYHTRWPDCLQFALYLAEGEVESGDETQAVSLLHQSVANDATGQVAMRLWGHDHRYRPLWPDALEIFFDLPVPAAVAAQLGRNQLAPGVVTIPPTPPVSVTSIGNPASGTAQKPPVIPSPTETTRETVRGTKYTPKSSPETVMDVEATFARLAKRMKKPTLGRADGRFPLYVMLTTKTGLDQQYGPQTRVVIEDMLKNLGNSVNQRPGWGSLVFIPDDAERMSQLGLKAMDALDPWKIKLALTDLDQALAKKGQMIGALLIVGGSEVVPFHKLPNPTDDNDANVPSDNPYGTLDANYFVPEWPVGRLPGTCSPDAALLLEQIRSMNGSTAKTAKSLPTLGTIVSWLLAFLKSRVATRKDLGFGYSAEVWKQSSREVFKVVSESGSLVTSPPEQSYSISLQKIASSNLEYYNLHGIEDGPDWYGQKDSASTQTGPDYPVAVSPRNLVKNGQAPQVIYTEACYGANILNKKEEEAMALKFMMIGAAGFVGSTVISYGSVGTPLIGADLLGYLFWRNLKDGMSTGEALMQAKISFVKEMTQRQGFLDGEDQKTLISFVLYGDPLAGYEASKADAKTMRYKGHEQVKMICDKQMSEQGMRPVSARVLNQVKAAVAGYLPGIEEPEVIISLQHEVCDGSHHRCPTAEMGEKSVAVMKESGVVITVSKRVQEAQHTHRKYARVTLNARGKMVKLVVSR
jgi:tetratricopeptide (TPR) repeat protein